MTAHEVQQRVEKKWKCQRRRRPRQTDKKNELEKTEFGKQIRKKNSESLREIQEDNAYIKYELDAWKKKQLQNKKAFLEIIC